MRKCSTIAIPFDNDIAYCLLLKNFRGANENNKIFEFSKIILKLILK